jgi:type II secretory pathway pseudopilin PulG
VSAIFFSPYTRQCGFRRLRSAYAFSLVEVVLALGVASFAILAIVSLVPYGLQSSKESLDESAAINVLSEVIADRQATPLGLPSVNYQLPALTNLMPASSNSFGISDSNPSTNTALSASRYRVDYVVTAPATGLGPFQAQFRVSWPATGANPSDFVEVVATFPQP